MAVVIGLRAGLVGIGFRTASVVCVHGRAAGSQSSKKASARGAPGSGGGVGSGVRLGLIFLQGEQGFGPLVDVARMADRVSTTLVKATTDQSQADW